MNLDEIKNLAQVAAKNIKTEADLNEFRQMLTKITIETALNADPDDHLGYSKHEASDASNSRNGNTRKTLQAYPPQTLSLSAITTASRLSNAAAIAKLHSTRAASSLRLHGNCSLNYG
ncbi:transposase [SAR92 clade bacterium H455]|uniref:Transposase n=1 Tax=SAR92 clade bacterium H455 TaxID=2974818 RepID=A0ABY5TKW3_9GAMM|nr:transposase [SAR92 clade bacterium H455]